MITETSQEESHFDSSIRFQEDVIVVWRSFKNGENPPHLPHIYNRCVKVEDLGIRIREHGGTCIRSNVMEIGARYEYRGRRPNGELQDN